MEALPFYGSNCLRIYADLPLRGDRAIPDNEVEMRVRLDAFNQVVIPVVIGMAIDISRIIDYALRLNAYKVIVIGWSLGALSALIATAKDKRIVATAVLSGPTRFVDIGLLENYDWRPADMEIRREYDPFENYRAIYPRQLLILHGQDDLPRVLDGARSFYDIARSHYGANSDRLQMQQYPNVAHELSAKMRQDVHEWACKVLQL